MFNHLQLLCYLKSEIEERKAFKLIYPQNIKFMVSKNKEFYGI